MDNQENSSVMPCCMHSVHCTPSSIGFERQHELLQLIAPTESRCLPQLQNQNWTIMVKRSILWANDISQTHFEMFPDQSHRSSWKQVTLRGREDRVCNAQGQNSAEINIRSKWHIARNQHRWMTLCIFAMPLFEMFWMSIELVLWHYSQ